MEFQPRPQGDPFFKGKALGTRLGGAHDANHNTTHSPSLARKNKIENDPKLRKNSERNRDDDMNFC